MSKKTGKGSIYSLTTIYFVLVSLNISQLARVTTAFPLTPSFEAIIRFPNEVIFGNIDCM